MAKDLHNFHLFCPRKWHYSGETNLGNGQGGGQGMFLHAGQIQAGAEHVDCVGIARRGDSNQWEVRFSQVWCGPQDARLLPKVKLAEEMGWNLEELEQRSSGHTLLRHFQVEFCATHWGVIDEHTLFIQVGKAYEGPDSDRMYGEPDVILPKNARIENWLRKHALRDLRP